MIMRNDTLLLFYALCSLVISTPILLIRMGIRRPEVYLVRPTGSTDLGLPSLKGNTGQPLVKDTVQGALQQQLGFTFTGLTMAFMPVPKIAPNFFLAFSSVDKRINEDPVPPTGLYSYHAWHTLSNFLDGTCPFMLNATTVTIATSREARMLCQHLMPLVQPAVGATPVVMTPVVATPTVLPHPPTGPLTAIFRYNGNGVAQVLMNCSSLPCVIPVFSPNVLAAFQPGETESKVIGGKTFTLCRASLAQDGKLDNKTVIDGREYTWVKLQRSAGFGDMTQTEFNALLTSYKLTDRSSSRLVAVLKSTLTLIDNFPTDLKNETAIAKRDTIRMSISGNYVPDRNKFRTTYSIVEKDTFASAVDMWDVQLSLSPNANPNIMVVNFANNYTAGGGYDHGCIAQEEDLFRCSDLPRSLGQLNTSTYYPINEVCNDDTSPFQVRAIFTPQCRILRRRSDYAFYTEEQYRKYKVSVCSIAAFNCGDQRDRRAFESTTTCQLSNWGYAATKSRIRLMFQMAAQKNVHTLIVGAFGCGVFRNPPAEIITLFNNVMREYWGSIGHVQFAVIGANHALFADPVTGLKFPTILDS